MVVDSVADLGAVFSGIENNDPRLPLKVPLKVDVGVGANWAEAH